jgi:hypothetical protein
LNKLRQKELPTSQLTLYKSLIFMKMDVTMKEWGRKEMTELCIYKVKDGKIVSEHFFM